ncbi:GCN5 family acetyltransferase [Mycobacterium adipatum]|jgi:RimJ/RimL family protein N-acetyltransferase|uniref:GCN5 family acetyltransferase n=1 Tax=Mycobacterium adipatum TaxID=1682113 RepID=A0A172UU83_9MYCO|nr:GNAT family protein [Mycobacterium adipatum]ANE82742.1 GCN5 family acetyltransferase [Mycobacterium adipatum]
MSFVGPVVLTGPRWVTLEPLQAGHTAEIAAAAAEAGDLWFTNVPTPDTAAAWVQARLADPHGFAFVVRRLDGTVIGSTSYLHIDGPNRRLEIGATWYVAPARRTGVNTEAKLLLLTHAFDVLDCVAVEFRTHLFNSASRAAIERLGAKLDGVLRSHQLLADGSRRDTAVYSILDIEWPAVRSNLTYRSDRTAPH